MLVPTVLVLPLVSTLVQNPVGLMIIFPSGLETVGISRIGLPNPCTKLSDEIPGGGKRMHGFCGLFPVGSLGKHGFVYPGSIVVTVPNDM